MVEGVLMPSRTEDRPAAAAAVVTVAGFSPRSSACSVWACARDLRHGLSAQGEWVGGRKREDNQHVEEKLRAVTT